MQTTTPDILNVLDFGAVSGGVFDCSLAIQTALDASNAIGSNNGRTVYIPQGVYRCASTLHVRHGLDLAGASGAVWYAGSILLFDEGVSGIIVDYSPTFGQPAGVWATIRNLAIKAAGKTVSGATGIRLLTRAKLRDLWVNNFSGDGIHIEANIPDSNANLWEIHSCRVDECGGWGLYVDGHDANAGYAWLLDCSANILGGMHDSALLPNTYVACHTSGNGGPCYEFPRSGLLLGCYSEGGQPDAILGAEVLVVAGIWGEGTRGGRLLGQRGYWPVARPGDTPWQIREAPGQTAPLIELMDVFSRRYFRAGPGGVGFGDAPLWPTSDSPLSVYRDQTTSTLVKIGVGGTGGYNSWVLDVYAGSDGGHFPQGWVTLRTPGPNGTPVDTIKLQNGRAIIGNGGLVLPRLTTTQRNNISPPPVPGTLIFNTDTRKLQCFDGQLWVG